jgi:hypothetical protein
VLWGDRHNPAQGHGHASYFRDVATGAFIFR